MCRKQALNRFTGQDHGRPPGLFRSDRSDIIQENQQDMSRENNQGIEHLEPNGGKTLPLTTEWKRKRFTARSRGRADASRFSYPGRKDHDLIVTGRSL